MLRSAALLQRNKSEVRWRTDIVQLCLHVALNTEAQAHLPLLPMSPASSLQPLVLTVRAR